MAKFEIIKFSWGVHPDTQFWLLQQFNITINATITFSRVTVPWSGSRLPRFCLWGSGPCWRAWPWASRAWCPSWRHTPTRTWRRRCSSKESSGFTEPSRSWDSFSSSSGSPRRRESLRPKFRNILIRSRKPRLRKLNHWLLMKTRLGFYGLTNNENWLKILTDWS